MADVICGHRSEERHPLCPLLEQLQRFSSWDFLFHHLLYFKWIPAVFVLLKLIFAPVILYRLVSLMFLTDQTPSSTFIKTINETLEILVGEATSAVIGLFELGKKKINMKGNYIFNTKMSTDNVFIRAARREDCQKIIELIQILADFEQMPNGPQLTEMDLLRDGFDTSPPLFRCFIAELLNGEIVGYALFYYVYSTWQGKSMYMEDLFVAPAQRNRGVGSKLFRAVVEACHNEGCSRLDFEVLSWNPARKFYEEHGAVNLTSTEEWHRHRMNKEAIISLLRNTPQVIRKKESNT